MKIQSSISFRSGDTNALDSLLVIVHGIKQNLQVKKLVILEFFCFV